MINETCKLFTETTVINVFLLFPDFQDTRFVNFALSLLKHVYMSVLTEKGRNVRWLRRATAC